jgi:hypothetical protein
METRPAKLKSKLGCWIVNVLLLVALYVVFQIHKYGTTDYNTIEKSDQISASELKSILKETHFHRFYYLGSTSKKDFVEERINWALIFEKGRFYQLNINELKIPRFDLYENQPKKLYHSDEGISLEL